MEESKIKIKLLILTKLETGDSPESFGAEAEHLYKRYCAGGEEYDIVGGFENSKLYVRGAVALYVTGMGKVNAALSTAAVLSDGRFDFSEAYFLSTGCGGASYGFGVMGDVYVITAVCDYDLGYHADPRELMSKDEDVCTWFHNPSFDSSSHKPLNQTLAQRAFDLVKATELKTTERTKRAMAKSFPSEKWAEREPRVLKGTSVTGDQYWKGRYCNSNAGKIAKCYACPDPYAISEMEDLAVALALHRRGLLDRLIILRTAVNMDVFMDGVKHEDLWLEHKLANDDNPEAGDLFPVAMENGFRVAEKIADAILDGRL